MTSTTPVRLGDFLLQNGTISHAQLNEALRDQAASGELLGRILVRLGHTNDNQINSALSLLSIHHKPASKPKRRFTTQTKVALTLSLLLLITVSARTLTPADEHLKPSTETAPQTQVASGAPAIELLQHEPSEPPVIDSNIVLENVSPSFDQAAIEAAVNATVEIEAPLDLELEIIDRTDVNKEFNEQFNQLAAATTTRLANISAVRQSNDTDQMRIVFEADRSLLDAVQREYLNNNEVTYTFRRARLNFGQARLVKNGWISESHFLQDVDNSIWSFTMAESGTAKYHELAPNGADDRYRFVIIIRQNS